jgi:hypothetical protein
MYECSEIHDQLAVFYTFTTHLPIHAELITVEERH